MAVDVRPSTFIRKPRTDVASFMFDPAHDTEWTGGISASRPGQPGMLVLGCTVERDAKFLGRTFTYGYVITAHVPGTMIEFKVDRPFPMLIRYELQDQPAGTLVAIHAIGTPGRFFGWAIPLMRRAVVKNIAADLERLRLCLEA